MALELALLDFTGAGDVRLLGRTKEPDLVEPVRARLINRQIEALRALGFGEDDDPGDIGGQAA